MEIKRIKMEHISAIIIFLTVILHIGELNQICIIDDEFGYWGIAAFFAGYDWTGLSGTSPYYGYGLSFFYTILFMLFSNPVIMYKAAIILNAIFLVVAYYISLHCTWKLCPDMDRKYQCLLCFLIALYPNTIVQSQITWTESLLYLWFWVLFSLVISISERADMGKLIVFGCLLVYGIMVHQRTLGVFVSGILFITFLVFSGRNRIRICLPAFVAVCLMLLLFLKIKGWLQDNFWMTLDVEIQEMNNFSGQISKIKNMFSLQGITEFSSSVIAKALYLSISTCLLIFPAFFCMICSIWKYILCWIKERKVDYSGEVSVCLFVLCSSATTFIISSVFMQQWSYRADTLLYGRYNEFVIGPVLMIGLITGYKNKNWISKSLYLIILILNMALIVYAILNFHNFTAFHSTNATALGVFLGRDYLIRDGILPAVFIALTVMGIVSFWCNKRFRKIQGLLLAILVVYLALWKDAIIYNNQLTYNMQEYYMDNTFDVAKLVEKRKDTGVIYVLDDDTPLTIQTDLYDRNIKYIQFYLYNRKIECQKYSDIYDKETENYYIVRKASGAYEKFMQNIKWKQRLIYCNNLYGLFY